jgi:hypothetical protein
MDFPTPFKLFIEAELVISGNSPKHSIIYIFLYYDKYLIFIIKLMIL